MAPVPAEEPPAFAPPQEPPVPCEFEGCFAVPLLEEQAPKPPRVRSASVERAMVLFMRRSPFLESSSRSREDARQV